MFAPARRNHTSFPPSGPRLPGALRSQLTRPSERLLKRVEILQIDIIVTVEIPAITVPEKPAVRFGVAFGDAQLHCARISHVDVKISIDIADARDASEG